MTPMLCYTVAMPQPTNHCFEVTAEIASGVGEFVNLVMPVWTPGSYMVREYSRHIQRLIAEDSNGQPLTCHKIAKNHWRIANPENTRVTVRYRLYANDLTVRTNHLDNTHGYFNGAAIFFYIPGHLEDPIDVITGVAGGVQPFAITVTSFDVEVQPFEPVIVTLYFPCVVTVMALVKSVVDHK